MSNNFNVEFISKNFNLFMSIVKPTVIDIQKVVEARNKSEWIQIRNYSDSKNDNKINGHVVGSKNSMTIGKVKTFCDKYNYFTNFET